jgi:heptaprenyl diphosphate synthase
MLRKEKMKYNTKKIVYLSLLSAIAIVLHTIEAALPLPFPLGVKLGFANIISLVVIEMYGIEEMFIVNIFRVIISGLITGNIMSYPFFMSCGGVTLSSLVLAFISHIDLPIISKSIISAVFHNIGQLLVLSYTVSTLAIMPYLFIMLVSSIPTGILTGLCTIEILKRLKIG